MAFSVIRKEFCNLIVQVYKGYNYLYMNGGSIRVLKKKLVFLYSKVFLTGFFLVLVYRMKPLKFNAVKTGQFCRVIAYGMEQISSELLQWKFLLHTQAQDSDQSS